MLVDLGEEDIHEAIRQRKAEEDHSALVALRATEAKAARAPTLRTGGHADATSGRK